MPAQGPATTKQEGFTLVELSIVLVIIGLIVGGILVGQDLIRAAETRATIGQIEKYNTAINTFRSKYNGIPGDLTSESATAFGFTARAGSAGRGDGNGLIEGAGTTSNQAYTQEGGMLWNDLSVASLIDGNYTSNAANKDSASGASPVVAPTSIPAVFPPARMGRGNYISTASLSSVNYWYLAGLTNVVAATGAYSALSANITPIIAYNMDIKFDDGLPEAGVVQAHGMTTSTTTPLNDVTKWTTATPGSAVAGDCVTTGAHGSDPTDTYNRGTSTGGTSPACMLRFRFN